MKEAAARAAYGAALIGLSPLYRAKLWWRGRAEPGYRGGDRRALRPLRHAGRAGALWIHAVSLGETRAAAALIEALRAARPGLRLLLTHGTATGRAAGAALLRDGDRQAWLPYDTPAAVRRFLAHFRPAAGVLMETEIWPNLLARRAGARRAGGAGQRAAERAQPAARPALRRAAAPGLRQPGAGAGADRGRRARACARPAGARGRRQRQPEVRHGARSRAARARRGLARARSTGRWCSPP